MTQEWTVTHAQHQVRVVRTDNGARLYVDDQLLDVTNDLYASGEEAALAGVFDGGEMFRVEAFVEPTVSICINGQCISDQAFAVASD